jgi:hypothetical protein
LFDLTKIKNKFGLTKTFLQFSSNYFQNPSVYGQFLISGNCQFGKKLTRIVLTTAPISESISSKLDSHDAVVVVVSVIVGEVDLIIRQHNLSLQPQLRKQVVFDDVSLLLSDRPMPTRVKFV